MQTVGSLLVAVVALMAMGVYLSRDVGHDHRLIAFTEALEILRTSHDEELRNAARGVLHDAVCEAIRVIRADPDARSAALLVNWGVK
jgi:hypothetical protein